MITWRGGDGASRALLFYLRGTDHPAKLRLIRTITSVAFPKGVKVVNSLGACLRVQPDDFISKNILWDGQYEGESLALGARLLQSGGHFVDVGANQGLYTCSLGVLPGVECVAIEPHAKNVVALQKNMALNPGMRARLFNVCLDRNRALVELEDGNPSNSGMVRVALNDRRPGSSFHTVAAVSLEELLDYAKVGSITLLKMDVEGYEQRVLDGFQWDSARRPANILIEYSDYVSRDTNRGKEGLLQFFETNDYEGLTIRGEPLASAESIPESNAWFRDRRGR